MEYKKETTTKNPHKYRQHIGGYQRRKGYGEGEMGKVGQLYGDGWKLDFWWGAYRRAYRCRFMMYTQNLYEIINQCYLNKKIGLNTLNVFGRMALLLDPQHKV